MHSSQKLGIIAVVILLLGMVLVFKAESMHCEDYPDKTARLKCLDDREYYYGIAKGALYLGLGLLVIAGVWVGALTIQRSAREFKKGLKGEGS